MLNKSENYRRGRRIYVGLIERNELRVERAANADAEYAKISGVIQMRKKIIWEGEVCEPKGYDGHFLFPAGKIEERRADGCCEIAGAYRPCESLPRQI